MNTPQEYISDADLELVSAYLDDEVSDAERAALEARLEREPVLRATLDELRATTQALRNLPRLAPPRSLTLDPIAMRPRWAGAFTWLRLGSALAAVLLALTLTIDLAGNGSSMQTASAPASAPMSAQRYTASGAAAAPTAAAAASDTGGAASSAMEATTVPAAAGLAPNSAANQDNAGTTSKAAAPTADAMTLQAAPDEQPPPAFQGTTGTISDTANLSSAMQPLPQAEQTEQSQRTFTLPTPARNAIVASGSSSPGTAALEPQQNSQAAAPARPRPLRLLEVSLAALTLMLALAALWVARRRG